MEPVPSAPEPVAVPDTQPQYSWNENNKIVVDAFAEDDDPPEIDPDSPISNPVNKNVIPPGGDGMRQSGSGSGKTPSYSISQPKINPALWETRKDKVKDAYRRDAWGKDEYHPIS